MRKSVIFSILSFIVALSSVPESAAQTSAVERINAIKRDTTYLYAEATTKIKEESLEYAKALLETNISQWLDKNKVGADEASAAIAKCINRISPIETNRGELQRAFVYVKKSDIITFNDATDLVLVKKTKNKDMEPSHDNEAKPAIVNIKARGSVDVMTYNPNDFEKSMLNVKSFPAIKDFISALKAEGRVEEFGKYQTIPSSGECYLFVYDKTGNIPACLHKTPAGYVNIKDCSVDSIKNYDGCGAIWFRLK